MPVRTVAVEEDGVVTDVSDYTDCSSTDEDVLKVWFTPPAPRYIPPHAAPRGTNLWIHLCVHTFQVWLFYCSLNGFLKVFHNWIIDNEKVTGEIALNYFPKNIFKKFDPTLVTCAAKVLCKRCSITAGEWLPENRNEFSSNKKNVFYSHTIPILPMSDSIWRRRLRLLRNNIEWWEGLQTYWNKISQCHERWPSIDCISPFGVQYPLSKINVFACIKARSVSSGSLCCWGFFSFSTALQNPGLKTERNLRISLKMH